MTENEGLHGPCLHEIVTARAQSGGIPRETPSAWRIRMVVEGTPGRWAYLEAPPPVVGDLFELEALYASPRSRSAPEPSAPAVGETPGPQITPVAWRDEWGYGVRACRGHWHIIGILEDGTEGEDLAIDGDPFATQQEAIDAAKAWCAKHSTRATPVSTENER